MNFKGFYTIRKEVYRQRSAIASAFVRHPGTQIDEHLKKELERTLAFCNLDKVIA